MALSKYNKVAKDEDDLELPYTDNQYRDRDDRLDAESNNYSIDDEDGSYDDDDDEEVAVQSPQLRRAVTTSQSSRSKCCIAFVVFLTLLVGLLASGKVYVDEYGVPDKVQGFYGRLRGKLEDWQGNKGGDEQIDALMNEDLIDEKMDHMDIQETNIDVTPPVKVAEDSVEQEEEENDAAIVEEQGEEFAEEQEEELEEEHIENVNEQTEDLVEKAANEEAIDAHQNLDYMLGATGMISTEWSVIEQVDHDKTSFTQGLSYGPENTIYETTGLYGQSKLRKINPQTFAVTQSLDIDRQYFGEGSTFYTDSEGNGRIIMITWHAKTGFIYDAESFELIKNFPFTTTAPKNEGWGITYDSANQEFIVSDGSPYLYFWDSDTLEEKRKVEITRFNGELQNELNELEFMNGLVCCNIWHSDEIICVDPTTGKSVREYDFTSLWPSNERGSGENVLNGIALGHDHVLITGKRWDRMYKISFGDWPSLFANNNAGGLEGEDQELEEIIAEQEETLAEELEELEEFTKDDTTVDESIEEIIAEQEEELEEEFEELEEETQDNNSVQVQNTISEAYTVVEQVSHDKTSFTQGLSYGNDGMIYETTGLYTNSKLRKINPTTFQVEKSVNLEGRYFGEGSAFYVDKDGNSRIIVITWKEQTGFMYDPVTLNKLSTFQYTTTAPKHEGWGITYDAASQEFIVSDGSAYLYFWDRDTLEEKRKVIVTRFNGESQNDLNELEFMDGLVCCNIWHMDDVICVDPTTGKSVREYDMSQLWPSVERGSSENVLNGIALGQDHVLITGKRWDRMYKVTFSDWPSLYADNNANAEEEIIEDEKGPGHDKNDPVKEDSDALKSLAIAAKDLPDYFVPLTPEERVALKEKLKKTAMDTVVSLLVSANPVAEENGFLSHRTFKMNPDSSKQFMHMHHMKTGGTSMDSLIHCAISRQLKVNNNTRVEYSSMSECGSGVRNCMSQLAKELNASVIDNIFYYNDNDGSAIMDAPFDPAVGEFEAQVGDLNICRTSDCGVMSYCASLHTVRTFGWKDVDKITVIRNPIDRAWSMYRFTLQSCYKCKELKDVLKEVASGTFKGRASYSEDPHFEYDPSDSCAIQMIGHQATNLLSSIDLYNIANDVRFPREKDIVQEAVKNLRESFTWIGLTDRLPESVDGFRAIFPFLAENLTEAVLNTGNKFESQGHAVTDPMFSLPEDFVDSKTCPFPHANAAREPTCGTTEMDDETIDLILKLNNRDRAVYQAAMERFDIQMEVLKELQLI